MATVEPRKICVRNSTRGTVVGDQVTIADTLLSRVVGLLGKTMLPQGAGLLIHPSQGVHTLGMKFPIDVIFLDRRLRVLEMRRALKPFRMTSLNFTAASVLELPVNAIENSLTEVDDQLAIEDCHD
ncbi:MAG TPA: DUF192 domain-containing protein [Candidatus Angelobacter sp.]|nr:DUF192 domain-containing protein [Candidatus Angelobacter sp.]